MNPLTQVKRTQQINSKEAALGISEEASWHAKYKDSAYIFVGGIPFDLTEGDILAVFAQYGEVVDVNLVRDKGTGKSKGFAFVAYEDQRSTVLAVDNLNGGKLVGRIMRVDHVAKYKKKEEEEEDEEKARQKREGRGVCYAFQRGECNRGDSCRFSHDEQAKYLHRCIGRIECQFLKQNISGRYRMVKPSPTITGRTANTGWGSREAEARWGHDKPEKIQRSHRRDTDISSNPPPSHKRTSEYRQKIYGKNEQVSRDDDDGSDEVRTNRNGSSVRDRDRQRRDKPPESHDKDWTHMEDKDRQTRGKPSVNERTENKPGYEKREKPPRYDRDSSSYFHKEDEREHKRKSHR